MGKMGKMKIKMSKNTVTSSEIFPTDHSIRGTLELN
jgi:hypothetical protein